MRHHHLWVLVMSFFLFQSCKNGVQEDPGTANVRGRAASGASNATGTLVHSAHDRQGDRLVLGLVKDGAHRPFVVDVKTEHPGLRIEMAVMQPPDEYAPELYAQVEKGLVNAYTLDCGNGDPVLTGQSGNIVCDYQQPGLYTISIYGKVFGLILNKQQEENKPNEHYRLTISLNKIFYGGGSRPLRRYCRDAKFCVPTIRAYPHFGAAAPNPGRRIIQSFPSDGRHHTDFRYLQLLSKRLLKS